MDRRRFLSSSLAAAGASVLPLGSFVHAAEVAERNILVVVELSGGNDGLNSVVPYSNDAYYRHRPTIGIKPENLLKLDDDWGLNPGMLGFERLWHSGQLAIIHGCGYDQPSYSHFTSMAYWHTGTPHRGDEFGWVGRLADEIVPRDQSNALINIGSSQSLAVKSDRHTPVVFDDPERFQRNAFRAERDVLAANTSQKSNNETREYLKRVAASAERSSLQVREAWRNYQTPIDYGIASVDLPKVASCIARGLPTQLYYVSFRNNAFDTHVQQPALHQRLLSYACDAIHGFVKDLERLNQAHRVAVLVFSEFGRRVGENTNQGTDHGSANTMFMAGAGVAGGHYGIAPDLDSLNGEDNLIHTVDFRRVYATAIDGWLQAGASQRVLNGSFAPFDLFL